ncbi:MAG TPA: helix-turn-helix transcriptional regulator [Candidatus Bathyarchaeia archaeon]|nr:helix-turn-helix transcriptional regulator [Candidatus Bathyarchaeia archaeon]
MLSKQNFTKLVSKKIKEERERKNISQESLAYEAGLYRTYIGHLENARYSPSAYVLYKLAKVLKIDPSVFFPKK